MEDRPVRISVVRESIQVPIRDEHVRCVIHEERLDFSTPPVLATSGWPFGLNPTRVDGLQQGVATVVDHVSMPSFYRVVRWMLLLTDDASDLAVSSTVQCMRRGDDVIFTEYAILGDYGILPYDLDVVVDGDKVKLVVTSGHAGPLTARTTRIGIFA